MKSCRMYTVPGHATFLCCFCAFLGSLVKIKIMATLRHNDQQSCPARPAASFPILLSVYLSLPSSICICVSCILHPGQARRIKSARQRLMIASLTADTFVFIGAEINNLSGIPRKPKQLRLHSLATRLTLDLSELCYNLLKGCSAFCTALKH